MPSHQDRISKAYSDLCSRCLSRKNREWDNETPYPYLCDVCSWINHLHNKVVNSLPESIIKRMTDVEKKGCLDT